MIDRFAQGPPDVEAADEAAQADEGALLALVDELLAAGRRAHLELMARPGFPKAVRKAAGRAAYKLRSAGVAAEAGAASATGPAVRLADAVALGETALVTGPGLACRYWFVLAELPGAAPVAVETNSLCEDAQVRVLDHLSPGRLRHYAREMRGEAQPNLPLVGSAALGVRMIDRLGDALRERGGAFPTGWTEVLWWRERAVALGADPAEADARGRLAGHDSAGETSGPELLDEPHSGPHVPEQAAIDALIRQVIEVVERRDELTRDELVQRLEGLADASCDAYYGRPESQGQVARALEGSADVLAWRADHGGGDPARRAAQQLLAVADEVASATRLPHEISLLRRSFRRIIDYEHAWRRHQAGPDDPEPA